MDEGESVREGKQQREREKERERRGEDQWEPPRSGLPGCQASCGLFVTMQCDSNGDSVLGAMSLMMNSSTTIIPPPHPRPPTFRLSAYAHTHTCLCTKHRSLPTNTHTHSDSTSPPPSPCSTRRPTSGVGEREQGLRLARAGLPPADSGGVFM